MSIKCLVHEVAEEAWDFGEENIMALEGPERKNRRALEGPEGKNRRALEGPKDKNRRALEGPEGKIEGLWIFSFFPFGPSRAL